MIPIAYLKECFTAQADGSLVWNTRPAHHFTSQTAQKCATTMTAGKVAGQKTAKGYIRLHVAIDGGYQKLMAHRVVWAMHTGQWPEGALDHVNGDRADNRIANLRSATAEQNASNARRRKDKTCAKGVCFQKRTGKWRARICAEGKSYHLGLFLTAEAASQAYAQAAARLHGEFARLA